MPAFVRRGLVAALVPALTGVVLLVPAAGGALPGPDLVAAYAFDDGAGTAAADASGNGHHGTITGATWTAGGRYGGALSFDGAGDMVSVADADSLDVSAELTVSAWVRPSALASAWRTVVAKESGAGRLTYGLYANRNTRVPFVEVHAGGARRGTSGAVQLPLNQWTHLAATYDGGALSLYLNGALAATTAAAGPISASTGQLRIGGNTIWPEWFHGLIDEVRIYRRALQAEEILRDANTSVAARDDAAPTAPDDLAVTGATRTSIDLAWSPAADDVGVAGYRVFLDGAIAGTTTATTFRFTDRSCGMAHLVGVEAFDAAGNDSARSTTSAATAECDASSPSVAVVSPAPGSVVSGVVTVAAEAADDDRVVGVQFTLDGQPLGGEDVDEPYEVEWDTRALPNGRHGLGATARDPSGNTESASPVDVEVDNSAVPQAGQVAAYAFEDGAAGPVFDSSGRGNAGALSGPTPTAAGRFRSAFAFDGVNDRINVPDSSSLDVTAGLTAEAWVHPTAIGTVWRTVVAKERSGGVVFVLYANRNTGVPAAQVWIGGSVKTANGAARLPANAWTHLAATYDGAAVRLYVDGSVVATTPASGAIGVSSGPLRVGGNAIWGEWFAGTIDEVRVYERALSEAEIRADMEAPVPVPPAAPALSVLESEDDQHVSGTTLYYRPRAGGSGRFSVAASTTDPDLAEIRFPTVFGADGSNDRTPPYEHEYAWSGAASVEGPHSVVAVNRAQLTSASTFAVVTDTTPPAGGSLDYPDGYDADGEIRLAAEQGADTGAGLDGAASRLERQSAPLQTGTCGPFGPWEPAVLADRLDQGSCARYRFRVRDNVGNERAYEPGAVARVDLTPPAIGLAPPSEVSGAPRQHYDAASRTHYYNPAFEGSFALDASPADAESGVGDPVFPDLSGLAGWTGAGLYSWISGAAAPGALSISVSNGAGLSASTELTVAADAEPPSGVAVDHPDGYDGDGVVPVDVDPGSDALSGVDSTAALLERRLATLALGACGAFGDWEPAAELDEVPSGSCAAYRYRSADNVGNESTAGGGGAALVDLTPPAAPSVTVVESPDTGRQHVTGTTVYYNPAADATGSFIVSADAADAESGVARVAFPAIFGGDGGGQAEAPYTSRYSWSEEDIEAGTFDVTAENGAGKSTSTAFDVEVDRTPPQGGFVDYPDGHDEDGSVSISTDAGTDAGAGLDGAAVALDRQVAAFSGGTCGVFGAWEPAFTRDQLEPATCARYRYRVSDLVGNEAVYASAAVVKVAPLQSFAPPVLTIAESEADEHVSGSTLFYNPSSGNAGAFTIVADVHDDVEGIEHVSFPAVFGADGGADATAPYEAQYAWSDRANVSGSFAVVAENGIGETTSQSFSVVLDEDGPTSDVDYPEGYVTGAVPVEVELGADGEQGEFGFEPGAGVDPETAVLERASAPLSTEGCGVFDGSWAPISLVAGLDVGVLPNTCYRYRLTVADRVGNVTVRAPGDAVKVDATAPDAPAGLAATSTETTATLSWTAAADNAIVGGYALSRDGVNVGNTWTTSYTFRNLVCGTAYELGVAAEDQAHLQSAASVLTVQTAACTEAPPPADVFVSPQGSDNYPCTAEAPCRSLNRAYRAASAGQTVEIGAGVYGSRHTITADPAKPPGAEVSFRSAAGVHAEIESLHVYASNVSFRYMHVTDDFHVRCGSDGVTFRDSKAGRFVLSAASNVALVDSEFGPYPNNHSNIQGSTVDCPDTSTNVLLDGVYVHDNYTVPHDVTHMECLTVYTVDGLTIRNSRFRNCEDFDILFKRKDAGHHSNVLIENSWFDAPYPDGSFSLSFSQPLAGGTYTNVAIRNNSFGGRLLFKPEVTFSDVRVVGNVGTDGPCLSVIAFVRNVWRDNTCGATDLQAPLGYVDERHFDFHLVPGAAAIDAGDPGDHPTHDIDGEPRPQGAAPDAGADERS